MGQPDDKPGFIEEVLSEHQVLTPDGEMLRREPASPDDEIAVVDEPVVAEVPEPEPEPEPEPTLDVPFTDWPVPDRALVDEALKKSGLIWVAGADLPGGQGFWHVWLDEIVYLLTGSGEQPATGIGDGDLVSVLVRSKDTTARLLSFLARVSVLRPGDVDWAAAASALASSRLNLSDSQQAPDRWAVSADIRLLRLTPASPDGDRPGGYPSSSGRAAPRPTPATTAGPKPRVLHRRHGSGRPLS